MALNKQKVYTWLDNNPTFKHANLAYTTLEHDALLTFLYDIIISDTAMYDQAGSLYPIRLKPDAAAPGGIKYTTPYGGDLWAEIEIDYPLSSYWGSVVSFINALAFTNTLDYKMYDFTTASYPAGIIKATVATVDSIIEPVPIIDTGIDQIIEPVITPIEDVTYVSDTIVTAGKNNMMMLYGAGILAVVLFYTFSGKNKKRKKRR